MPNAKRGFGGVMFIIVILIILGGGAYLWSQKKVEAPAPTDVLADNSFKTLPAPTNDTSDWKTYRNNKYGFEVRYPDDFSEIAPHSRSDGDFDSSCLSEQMDGHNCRSLFSARLSGGDNYAYGFDVFVFGKNKIVGPSQNLNSNLFEKGNMIFFLSISGTNPSANMVDVYNQILSTFRFIK